MVRSRLVLRSVAAGLGAASLLAGPWVAPAPATADEPGVAQSPERAAGANAVDDAPLVVTINDLEPSYIPERGRIVVSGRVTNRDDVPWETIKLYTFLGDDVEPMRNTTQLSAALEVPVDADVGEREVTLGTPDKIAELAPGESASYTVSVPVSAFDVVGGVYWFGVHAVGASENSPRDEFTDGRARTFLPYLPRRVLNASPLDTSIVVPLTRRIPYNSDGSLAGASQWQSSLEPGGRLRDLITFGQAAGPGAVTWLLDPALPDAVRRLARENPPRSLEPSVVPETGQPGTPTAEPGTGDPTDPDVPPDNTDDSDDSDDSDEPTPEPSETAQAAIGWLEALRQATGDDEVLTLPYGNLDVSAATTHDPELLGLARAQRSTELRDWGTDTSPAVVSPSGYLSPAAVATAEQDEVVLLGDQMFGPRPPTLVTEAGQRSVVTSTGAAQGGPGPESSLTTIGLRQRILAEAAIRALEPSPRPLVVVLPVNTPLDEPAAFFDGLDVPWLELGTLREATGPLTPQDSEGDLIYPDAVRDGELDASTFDQIDTLIESGETLQNVLTSNTTVAGVITEQALAAAAYPGRSARGDVAESLASSTAWVEDRLDAVTISAPRGVTLSSETGNFATTLTNELDQPVTVTVSATSSDRGVEVTPPEPVQIDAKSSRTVLLDTRASSNQVHTVTLVVTDTSGTPLGSTDELPIRSAQVSDVIWLIMGTGAGLLFVAIGVRLFRRIRRARRGEPAR